MTYAYCIMHIIVECMCCSTCDPSIFYKLVAHNIIR